MKKSKKRLTVNTHTKNSAGFRVRTEGIDLVQYNRNPLLLWMHKRPKGERTDEVLPLGNGLEVQLNGEELSTVPSFDDTDDFAMKICNKVDNGTLRMASAGLKPKEFRTDENGEIWLHESELFEISICDIGANPDALAVSLYDESGSMITLSQAMESLTPDTIKTQTESTMKTLTLTAGTLGLLKLADNANEADAHKAILNLVTLADTQKTEIETLKADKKKVQEKLDEQVKLADSGKLIALVDKAVEDRKITADQKEDFLKLDFASADSILGKMKGAPTVASKVATGKPDTDELMKLSYDELDKSGKLITLKENNLEGFKEKFKEKWNKEYQG